MFDNTRELSAVVLLAREDLSYTVLSSDIRAGLGCVGVENSSHRAQKSAETA